MENKAHALAAGIFVLLFSLAAAMALWWMGRDDQSVDRYVLETRKNVTGLNVQATVRYRGIRAGKVDAIEPDPEDPRVILVFISLDRRFKLTRGSTAQLGYQGVTGLAYVQIEDDGSSSAILPTNLDDPPRIALKQTVFDTLGERAGDIVAQIGAVAARLAQVMDEKNARNLARTLENVAQASEGMKELPLVMASLREVLSAANLLKLQQILAHVEKTSGQAAPLAADLRDMVKSMSAMAQRVDRLAGQAGEVGDDVSRRILPEANALLRELTANSRQLRHLIEMVEKQPQMLLLGAEPPRPGPGESGFATPEK
jgi:phospholipid/cholesterol/gamma-HCH transport system substrate-binding protein